MKLGFVHRGGFPGSENPNGHTIVRRHMELMARGSCDTKGIRRAYKSLGSWGQEPREGGDVMRTLTASVQLDLVA